ncbi:peptidylprolyl isomerase [bacterium]|nr:peptidylprolyl isomerase [bacterium]
MKRLTFAMVLMLTLAPLACVKQPTQTTTAKTEEKTMAQPTPTPAATPAANKLHPQILFQTTAGDITLELDGEKAPISTLNFVQYVKDGYFNGTIFHRTIPGFMIQGGGYTENFAKKPGQRQPIKNEWRNGLKNARGTISMARLPIPDSATSEFFINVGTNNDFLDQPQRDGAAYAVFGKVINGMDVVDKIVAAPADYNEMGEKAKPVKPVIVKEAKLTSEFDQAAVEKLAQGQ